MVVMHATRALLLRTAERLYAERGLSAVSLRQIVEAAGVANNSALTYHIGTRADVIGAIADLHAAAVTRHTSAMVTAAHGSADPLVHVACLVMPYVRHLAELGHPSWCARFTAQLAADPSFGDRLHGYPSLTPLLEEARAATWSHAPALPAAVASLRADMVRLTVIHTCAEQETRAAPVDWPAVGAALTDAIAGLVLAPAPLR